MHLYSENLQQIYAWNFSLLDLAVYNNENIHICSLTLNYWNLHF